MAPARLMPNYAALYVYLRSEPGLWTVGFYRPNGEWEPESDHTDSESAANRAAWLNGSRHETETP